MEVGADAVSYVTTTRVFSTGNKREKIRYHHRSAGVIFKKYVKTIVGDKVHEIEKLELLFGGDHGKGAFTFLFVVIVRFIDGREPNLFEFQIGQIDSKDDSVTYLRPLIMDLQEGVQQLLPDKKGDGFLVLDGDDMTFGVPGETDQSTVNLEFWLIGNLKFLS